MNIQEILSRRPPNSVWRAFASSLDSAWTSRLVGASDALIERVASECGLDEDWEWAMHEFGHSGLALWGDADFSLQAAQRSVSNCAQWECAESSVVVADRGVYPEAIALARADQSVWAVAEHTLARRISAGVADSMWMKLVHRWIRKESESGRVFAARLRSVVTPQQLISTLSDVVLPSRWMDFGPDAVIACDAVGQLFVEASVVGAVGGDNPNLLVCGPLDKVKSVFDVVTRLGLDHYPPRRMSRRLFDDVSDEG